jgi:hypothetical protein
MSGMWILLTALAPAALASDVVLPEFSAGSMADFATAEAVTAAVESALRARSLSVEGPDLLVARHPDLAIGCAETPGCPAALLARTDGALAVVGDVQVDGERWDVTVRFFAPGQLQPVQVMRRETSAKTLPTFTATLTPLVEALLPSTPPEPEPEPVEVLVVSGPTEAERSDPRLLALPQQAQDRFLSSGRDLELWLEDAAIRTGHVYLELVGGAAFGDVTRRYDTRVSVTETSDDAFSQSQPYEYESFIQGTGGSVGLSLGYAATWWLEVGAVASALVGQKELSAGWEQRSADGVLLDENTIVYDPVVAVLGTLEPRLRMFLSPTGAVKPYAQGGLHLRIYDAYVVPDVEGTIDYTDRPGGIGAGVMLGGGLAFEGRSPVTGFIEVPWTYLMAPQPHLQAGEDLVKEPNQAPGSQQVLQLRAGLGVRL